MLTTFLSVTPLTLRQLQRYNLTMVLILWVHLNFDHCKYWVDKHKKDSDFLICAAKKTKNKKQKKKEKK